ncbi:MAG: 1-acyl-sn-glycerol-3-phosphate acyltransferase [Fidelibacterota bacterium]|nr:MAG: 1-acyl-sn-glycerol-3-phosphate acyltransferase [Candidatus Neomarinimicrobiota bacterium]
MVPFLWVISRPKAIGNMPQSGPCFIIASHSNPFDGFIMNVLMLSEPTASVVSDEYFRGGLITQLFQKIGLVPTRKFEPQSTPVREMLRFIKDNRIIIIMPEGERNWDGITRPTVASTGKLFRRLGVPVYPVIMHNGYLSWPGWAQWPRFIKMYLEFKPPLVFTPEMTDDEVAKLVDESIQWNPDKDMKDYVGRIPRGFRPAMGIDNLIFRCPYCRESDGLKVTRGRYLVCTVCDSRWRVGGDSYLTDVRTGERRSSTEVFRHVCGFPRDLRDFGPLGKGFVRTSGIPIYREVKFPNLEIMGNFDAVLREDRVDFIPVEEGGETIAIPFDDIQSISVEKRYRLQIRLPDVMYELHVHKKSSALQWAVYLQMMLPHLSRHLIRPMSTHYETEVGDDATTSITTPTDEGS